MKPAEMSANRLGIHQQPQRQDSLAEQLADLHVMAGRLGMYDAADWLWKSAFEGADIGSQGGSDAAT